MSAFLEKLTSKGTWRQVFIRLRPPSPPMYDPILPAPPLHTVCVQYTFTQGRGGRVGELNQGEGKRGNASQSR